MEKKGKGDTYSSHSGSKKKPKERMAEVQPVWAEYFEFLMVADEEDDASGSGDASFKPIVEIEEGNKEIAAS